MRNLDILESWKEIADYLKKAERTCRRWEKEYNLPIHRMDGSPKARVFAYKHELDKWIQEMLHAADDSDKRRISFTFQLTLRKALFPLIGALALVIIALFIWHPWSKEQAVLIPSDKPYLAIMYFDNNTGDEGLDHWRKMLADLLNTDLTQSRFIKVLSSDSLYKILSQLNQLDVDTYSTDILDRVAAEGRVSHFLLGRFTRMGETFRIDAMLKDVKTGEILSPMRVEAQGEEEVFPKVDELTRMVKANFELTQEQINQDVDEKIQNITTSSPEALKLYVEGREYYRKGRPQKAVEAYEKAISIDPEFAIAYRDLAAAYSNLRYPDKWHEYNQKAYDLRDRVSLRERLRIEGDFLRSKRRFDEAEKVYEELLKLYPDDMIGNNSLGRVYELRGELEKARERYDHNIKNEVDATQPYTNVAGIYKELGEYQKAEDVLIHYLNNTDQNDLNNTDQNDRIRRSLIYTYLHWGKYDLALLEAEKIDPSRFRLSETTGDIYFCMGDWIRAENEYRKMLKEEEKSSVNMGRTMLTLLYFHQGRFEEAIAEAEEGIKLAEVNKERRWEMAPRWSLAEIYLAKGELAKAMDNCEKALSAPDWPIYTLGLICLKGSIHLRMQELEKAEKLLKEIRTLQSETKRSEKFYQLLLGEIELEKRNFPDAIEHLTQAVSLLPFQNTGLDNYHSRFFESLARAYYLKGDLENAVIWYEKIQSLTTSGSAFGYTQSNRPKSYYMFGKIYEQQGDKAKAIEHYEKFLSLWTDADPGIAEVEDARERLVEL